MTTGFSSRSSIEAFTASRKSRMWLPSTLNPQAHVWCSPVLLPVFLWPVTEQILLAADHYAAQIIVKYPAREAVISIKAEPRQTSYLHAAL